jgi:opacity protein-like surface antigen
MRHVLSFALVLGTLCASAAAQSADEWYRRYYGQYEDDPTTTAGKPRPVTELSMAYLVVHGGGAFPTNGGVAEPPAGQTSFGFDVDWKKGWAGGIGGGAYLRPIRLELDGTVFGTHVQTRVVTGAPFYDGSADRDGHVLAVPIMANVYLDLPLTQDKGVQIYLGGGVGTEGLYTSGDDDWVFAYQFTTGLALRVAQRCWLTASYRLLSSTQFELNQITYDAPWVHLGEIGLRVDL